jgi:hypothetical protein
MRTLKHNSHSVNGLLGGAAWVVSVCLGSAAFAQLQLPQMPVNPAATPPATAPNVTETILPAAPGDEDTEDLVEAMRKLKGIKIKSLFFDKDDISYIRYSLRIYLKDTQSPTGDDFNEEEFLKRFSQIRDDDPKVTTFVYPQFFVDSIMYHTQEKWALWVSEANAAPRQITQDTNKETNDIYVTHVNKDQVTLVWRPFVMEKVNEVWAKSPNEEVQVNKSKGTVTFTIHPNQTFTSYLMKAVDGKLKPVIIGGNEAIAATAAHETDVQSTISGDIPPEAAHEEDKQGIEGLLNKYNTMPGTQPVQQAAPVAPSPAGNAISRKPSSDKSVSSSAPPSVNTIKAMPPAKPELPKPPQPKNELPKQTTTTKP